MHVRVIFWSLILTSCLPAAAIAAPVSMPSEKTTGAATLSFKRDKDTPAAADTDATVEPRGIEAYQDITNPWLHDVLVLNHQNQLLEKLVARQAHVGELQKNYAGLGVAYDPPPPPRDVCEQLPMNSPCGKAYPDLYGGYVEKRREEIRIEQERIRRAKLAEEAQKSGAPAAKPAEEIVPNYAWKDIKCVASRCTAILQDLDYKAQVKTVHTGETVFQGITVSSITRDGVKISIRGKKTIDVPPAPLDTAGGRTGLSTGGMASEVQKLLNNSVPDGKTALAKAPDAKDAKSDAQSAPTPEAKAKGGASDAPVLGPTGLF